MATAYVLPKPGRPAGELVLPGSPEPRGPLRRHRDAAVAQAIGARTAALLESQKQFLAELRSCLEEVEEGVVEAARARMQAQVRTALSVLEWCDAVQRDLETECGWAERGLQPIALLGFCADVAAEWRGDRPVEVCGQGEGRWWGDAGLLAETLESALALVAERAREPGSLAVEVAAGGRSASIRVAAAGIPAEDLDPATVRIFRQNVERLRAVVQPDPAGPVGLVLDLPILGDGV